MPRLLITRAHAQAIGFAAKVRAHTCLEPIISPMQDMHDLAVKIDLSGSTALAFTSKNGVEAYARMSAAQLPAYCVGAATAARAQALGFAIKAVADNATALRDILPESGVLHVHGRHVRHKLGARQLALYDQVALPLSAEALTRLRTNTLDAVALFSPRSASLFAQNLPETTPPKLVLYTLSEAVAAALPAGLNIRICPAPRAAAMLRLLSADFPA